MSHVKSCAWEIEMAQFQNGSKYRSCVFLLRWLKIQKEIEFEELNASNFENSRFSTWKSEPSQQKNMWLSFWAIFNLSHLNFSLFKPSHPVFNNLQMTSTLITGFTRPIDFTKTEQYFFNIELVSIAGAMRKVKFQAANSFDFAFFYSTYLKTIISIKL